jgi:succinate dehydrogenase / fumarate reductase cytochrome b subunit
MSMGTDRRQFVLRRLHSLTGIVPIGAYLIFHVMLANASVLGGPKRFEGAVAAIALLPPPILLAIECIAIYIPLLFHAGYGFIRVRDADLTNPFQNERLGAWLYTSQRLTGVIAFFFIGWHVWTTRVQYYFFGAEITYDMMHHIISQPINMAIFMIGALASVFHFTNGIWTFCVTWGITVGRQAQRAVRAASFVLFAVMGTTVFAILMAFRA